MKLRFAFILIAIVGMTLVSSAQGKNKVQIRIFESEQYAPEVVKLLTEDLVKKLGKDQWEVSKYATLSVVARIEEYTITNDLSDPEKVIITGKLQVAFGDFLTSSKIALSEFNLRGEGNGMAKAMSEALSMDAWKNFDLEDMLASQNQTLRKRYEEKCDVGFEVCRQMSSVGFGNLALYYLQSIPPSSGNCFGRALESIPDMYSEYSNQLCGDLSEVVKISVAAKNAKDAKEYFTRMTKLNECASPQGPNISGLKEMGINTDQLIESGKELHFEARELSPDLWSEKIVWLTKEMALVQDEENPIIGEMETEAFRRWFEK